MKKVLIITYYWPPEGGSGVQRAVYFAKYLREFGWEPIIYTIDKEDYPIVDESLQAEIPEGVEVIKQAAWEPFNLYKKILGKSKQEAIDPSVLNNKKGLLNKLLLWLRANVFIPDARMFWIRPSVKRLSKYIVENRLDAVISTGPPHSVHLIAQKLKEKHQLKWVSDFRDPWLEIDYFHTLPLTYFSKKRHEYLERKVVECSDTVIVVGETMKQYFSQFNPRTNVITNGYDGKVEGCKTKLESMFTITYVGLMNEDRNPVILWEVLSDLMEEDPQFAADFSLRLIGKLSKEVKINIEESSFASKVDLVGYLPHYEVEKFQRNTQLLLLVVNNVPTAKGIVTGKIFEYLKAKRPIVALAPENGDLAKIISDTNSGEVVDFGDYKRLKSVLRAYYADYKKQKLECQSVKIEKYHRRELTKKLSEQLNKL